MLRRNKKHAYLLGRHADHGHLLSHSARNGVFFGIQWDGKRVEIRRPLILTWPQKIAALMVTVFAVLGGLGALVSGVKDGAEYLCARDVHWLSCPPAAATPQPEPTPQPQQAEPTTTSP